MAGGRTTDAAGIVVVDPSGFIEEVDDVVCALLGYERAELVGMHGADLIPAAIRPRTAAAIDRMRRGEVTTRSGTMRRKDGSTVTVHVEVRGVPGGRLVLELRPA
jgi:PAS domain S-box-containing protein